MRVLAIPRCDVGGIVLSLRTAALCSYSCCPLALRLTRTSCVQVVERILKQPTTGPALVISATDSRRFLGKGELSPGVCLMCAA
jgi:hypothetical protein